MPDRFSRTLLLISPPNEEYSKDVDKAHGKGGEAGKELGRTMGQDGNPARKLSFEFVDWLAKPGKSSLLLLVYGSVDRRFPLGRRILLSSRRDAVDDRYADQTENAYADPLQRHMKEVGTERQADNQYAVADDVNPE
jgi:hypothetical protein